MVDLGAATTRGERRPDEFVSALHALKQQGCALLVVGSAPDYAFRQACQRILGDTSRAPRRRLSVVTDRDISTATTLLSTVDPELNPSHVKLLSVASESRRSAAQAPPAHAQIPLTYVDGADLAELSDEILDAIETFEDHGSALEPAELRVCIDSLTPLVDRDSDTLVQFIETLNTRIRTVSGMGQMHLHADRQHDSVELLEPLFDVVIELREVNNEPQQQWHLTDTDVCSGWIAHR